MLAGTHLQLSCQLLERDGRRQDTWEKTGASPPPAPPVEFSPKSLDAPPGEMGLSPCRSGQGPWDGAEAGVGGRRGCAVAVASDTLSGAAGRVGCDCWNVTGR